MSMSCKHSSLFFLNTERGSRVGKFVVFTDYKQISEKLKVIRHFAFILITSVLGPIRSYHAFINAKVNNSPEPFRKPITSHYMCCEAQGITDSNTWGKIK